MPLPLAAARLLGAGLLSATEAGAARGALFSRLAGAELASAVFRGAEDAEDGPEDITVPVASSAIRSIGWRKDGVIIVEFNARGTYTYDGSYELFQAFIHAPSKGGFFNAHFK